MACGNLCFFFSPASCRKFEFEITLSEVQAASGRLMFLRIDDIKRIQQQLVDILKVGFQQPRLDLGQQMTLIGLAVIRFQLWIEDIQFALIYAGEGQVMAAACKRAGRAAG